MSYMKKSIGNSDVRDIYIDLLMTPKQRKERDNANWDGDVVEVAQREIRNLSKMMDSYTNAPGAVVGNMYGALQGVTHYVDHKRGREGTRLGSGWFGDGAKMKSRAVEILVNA